MRLYNGNCNQFVEKDIMVPEASSTEMRKAPSMRIPSFASQLGRLGWAREFTCSGFLTSAPIVQELETTVELCPIMLLMFVLNIVLIQFSAVSDLSALKRGKKVRYNFF